jgi:hypothetical protein
MDVFPYVRDKTSALRPSVRFLMYSFIQFHPFGICACVVLETVTSPATITSDKTG